MAGIYVHIPYCKVKCHYCDFHFSTNSKSKGQMVNAICQELRSRKSYLGQEEITTIYFGGGTPSLLNEAELSAILNQIHSDFMVHEKCEVSFECNPDDLNVSNLTELKTAGVNRLSIGVQSFDDDVLSFMNRAHKSNEAITAIKTAQDLGFDNITSDLIYGLPDKGLAYWELQLQKMLELDVPHISAYCLTIENNTVFENNHKKGELVLPDDNEIYEQFVLMVQMLDPTFMHYEISNFAKEGYISQHNSSYWLGKPYLGVGPSAHSYDGDFRGWNVSNNHQYIKAIGENQSVHEREELTISDKVNDYILTRLRTHWGMELEDLDRISEGHSLAKFQKELEKHLSLQNLVLINGIVRLTEHGKFIADKIASDLFV